MRKTYAESVHELVRQGFIEPGQAPPSPPTRRPAYDDDVLGLQFFRTAVTDADFSDLTLPGIYFGRSEIARTSFRNCDLSWSTLCWNDFIDVDFSNACLADCDLRGAMFEDCNFTGADLSRALIGRDLDIDLSDAQRETVVWNDDEPPGG